VNPVLIAPLSGSHRTYATIAEHSIREMILDGRLQPGDRLNEAELAEQFDISRAPLREAIQRLVTEGLVARHSHRGAFVRTFEESELTDLYGLRAALELWAVRAIDVHDPDVRESLTALLAQNRGAQASGSRSDEIVDVHRELLRLSGNLAIVQAHELAVRKIQLARSRSARRRERVGASRAEHEAVLAALVAGDLDAAESALRHHLLAAEISAETALGETEPIPSTQGES
jgi:DNA-binding GntR family transcriptional regulator